MQNRTTIVLTAAVIGASYITLAQAQDTASKKSPELQVLDRFVGEWEETVIQRTPALPPERSTITASGTRKWILNGHMIENKGVWSPSKNEFLHLTTYDAKQGEYRQFYFDENDLDSAEEYRGKWDEGSKTLTFRGKTPNGVQLVLTQRFIDDDTFTWKLVGKDRTGKVVIDVEAESVRKKK